MNVLLIEDQDEKAFKVSAILNASVKDIQIVRARSFRSGTKHMESGKFDLLVLDMVLPIRDGEEAVEYGGKNVLAEIQDGSFCRRPSHIICLTAYEEVANAFRDEASKLLVHLVCYTETDKKWSEALTVKAKQIEQRICEANRFPVAYEIDLAIITSSPLVELQEVLKLPGFVGEFHQQDALYYYKSHWKTSDGKNIAVIACAAPSMGMTSAAITASKIINRWRPKFLAMTGIAAGTKAEQQFGDILIAESAYDYGSGKISDTETGDRIFTPSFNQMKMDSVLYALLQRWERDQIHADIIRQAWYKPLQNCPRISVGVLASGAAVVQSKELVQEILERSRKVVGLDMEAFGVMHAVNLSSIPAPRVLVVKSVSDFADSRKDDEWQQYAAFTSARFVYEFFKNEVDLKLGS